jgi:hypothetical protein
MDGARNHDDSSSSGNRDGSRELVPIPDPTTLTTDLGREIEARAKEYTDLRIEVLLQRLSDMDRAAAVLDETVNRTPTEIQREVGHLRELIYAELEGNRRGLVVAEQEREKSAQALRTELGRSQELGDTKLREHILQEIARVVAALEAAERLELQRFESLRKETELITQAANAAIEKAEVANDKRFDALAQVHDAQMEETRRAIADLTLKVSRVGA